MKAPKIFAIALIALVLALLASPAYAHGFGQRYDLPVPLNMFLIGAVATVALSFLVIGLFVGRRGVEFRYPRLNLLRGSVVGPVLSSSALNAAIGILSVAVFSLVVVAGLFGVNEPIDNFAPTFVWIIWWVGIGYLVAFMGNVWAIANPWQLIFTWLEAILGVKGSPKFRWPSWLDAWPALLGFFFFAWIENVFPGGSRPYSLAWVIVTYSLITWIGMFLFGKYVWLKRGDPFSVLFALFARFSPTEVRVAKGGNKNVCVICI